MTGTAILKVLRELSGEAFEWRRWGEGGHSIDRLAGTPLLREGLEAGVPWRKMVARWEPAAEAFAREKRELELYP